MITMDQAVNYGKIIVQTANTASREIEKYLASDEGQRLITGTHFVAATAFVLYASLPMGLIGGYLGAANNRVKDLFNDAKSKYDSASPLEKTGVVAFGIFATVCSPYAVSFAVGCVIGAQYFPHKTVG